jgi:hypothetical protein
MTEVKQDALAINSVGQLLEKTEPQSAQQTRIAAFTPTNLTEAIALSKLIASSELAPKDYRGKPGNVLIAMQMGAELGVAPMQALANIAVINGRASVWGDLALALVQVHPAYEWHKEWIEGTGDNRVALFQIKRRGQEAHTAKFSVQQAKEAKLWQKRGYNGQDTPWITHPERMLAMRARGFGLRDKFADALRGMILAEEAMDIPVDTSDAKKQRETATLDITSTLSQSSEPNRGHSDTGLSKNPSPKLDEQTQAPAKESPTMCGECRQIGGHKPECKYVEKAEQDAKTSKPTNEKTLRIDKIEKRQKTKADKDGIKHPYLILSVTDDDNLSWFLYVWDTKFHEYLTGQEGKMLICEYAQSKQGDKTYCSLKHIYNLGSQTFVNDKPVSESASMPSEADAEVEAELFGDQP